MEQSKWRIPNPMPAESEIAQTISADIVIIGGGQAGTCAARAATENGATVIVIEKNQEARMRYNGGGQVGQINSNFAKSRGLPEVDPIEFLNDWQLRSNNRSNAGLISKFVQGSGPCMDWILSRLSKEDLDNITISHVSLDGTAPTFQTDLSGIKTWVGCVCLMPRIQAKALNALRRESEANGATWLYDSIGWNLCKEDGRVVGAVAKTGDGRYIRCNASKGVILSCGDFGGDAEMVRDLCTEPTDLMPELKLRSMAGCDGTGHKLGVWAGGKLEPRPLSSMGGNYTFPGNTPGDPIGTTAALWLNAHGKRYCNEGFGDAVLSGIPGLRQPKGMLSVVFDSNIFEQLRHQAPGHLAFDVTSKLYIEKLQKEMDQAISGQAAPSIGAPPAPGGDMPPRPDGDGPFMGGEPGGGPPEGPHGDPHGGPNGAPPGGPMGGVTLVAAETLEDLAEKLGYHGIDKETFLQSIARYNEICHSGRDTDFGKSAELLFPVEKAPFFGYQSEKAPGPFMVTTGGLLTDENQNVLGDDFEPIPGLYATGNVCGGRFGLQYTTPVSGISIGIAQTLGREVGMYLARL